MCTYIIMLLVVLFLAGILLINARFRPDADHVFDKENTRAMRGFWCLIVILVHVPAAYQNRIQDMLGSFAYIGVTFFFMTSAYGLELSYRKNPESIRYFWRKRLPKLILPCILVNLVNVLILFIEGMEITVWDFILINGWVQWLLVCYLIFWMAYRFVRREYQDMVICILVMCFSAAIYLSREHITRTTWCPEVYGFIWGILFFHVKGKFVQWIDKKWLKYSAVFCLLALGLGVCYLKLKSVVFLGDYCLKIVLGLAIILFMIAMNTRIGIGNKVNRFLGSISFEVYLLHNAVFELISYMFPELNSGVFIAMSIVVTVIVSTVIWRLSERVLSQIDLRI